MVTTTGRAACTWTLDDESLALKITSGSDQIWSGTQCPAQMPSKDLTVRAAKASSVDFVWQDTRRSDPGCTSSRGWALDGYYHVLTAPLGGEPVDVQFKLSLPERPTITPSPSKSPKSKKSDKQQKSGTPKPSGSSDQSHTGDGTRDAETQ